MGTKTEGRDRASRCRDNQCGPSKISISSLHFEVLTRVPLIAQSWNPGLEEVETQGGNGVKWESERGSEREGGIERESVEKCCLCLQNDLKEP